MRRIVKKQVVQEREVVVEFRCDLCGSVSNDPVGETWKDTSDSDTKGSYTTSEIQVSLKNRTYWPITEDTEGYNIEIDLCPKCFRDVLVPFLESKGIVVRRTNVDY